jgi:hypothetical protein
MPPAGPQTAPAEPAGTGAAAAAAEFATLTLARIYESQGYYQKALGIYDELLRRHPGDSEIAVRRAALQRRLAGVEEPVAPPPASAPQTPVEWRLVDASALAVPSETADRLRQRTQEARDAERARRHTVQGAPPVADRTPPSTEPLPPAPAREDVSRGHADFERFLAYVRSLQRED